MSGIPFDWRIMSVARTAAVSERHDGSSPVNPNTPAGCFQDCHTRGRFGRVPIGSALGAPASFAGQFSATKVCQEKISNGFCAFFSRLR